MGCERLTFATNKGYFMFCAKCIYMNFTNVQILGSCANRNNVGPTKGSLVGKKWNSFLGTPRIDVLISQWTVYQ